MQSHSDSNRCLLTIGPIFLKATPPPQPDPAVVPLGVTIEIAWDSEAHRVPLFRKVRPYSNDNYSFHDIVLRELDMPCGAEAMAFFIADTPAGRFFPLDSILFALYETNRIQRPLRSVLSDCREMVPFEDQINRESVAYKGAIAPALAEQGFSIVFVDVNRREVAVLFGWIPPQDRIKLKSPSVYCAKVGYRMLPDGTMANGRWYGTRKGVGAILGREMRGLCRGPLKNLLTTSAQERLMGELKLDALQLPSAESARREARSTFIREHPELQSNMRTLADKMMEAGLYSRSTQITQVVKNLPRLIAEAYSMRPTGKA